MVQNKQIIFVRRPVGKYVPHETFSTNLQTIPNDILNGYILVKILYLSLDPAMRGWMNDSRSYIKPVAIGDVMRSAGVGRVVQSKNPKFKVGSLVTGTFGWQEYYLSDGSLVDHIVLPHPKLRLEDAISTLGLTGLTAYFGMIDIGRPVLGDTVVVSGAAGATGSVAGQIAKMMVGRTGQVIGIAGDDDKCKWLVEELGFDKALNYKDPAFEKKLKDATPKYINVYFDNVGGTILDACLSRLATFGRVALCGAISQYNAVSAASASSKDQIAIGPAKYTNLIAQRGKMEGFIVFDYKDRFPEATKKLATWIVENKVKSKETIVNGLENAPISLENLFSGKNTGKMLIRVSEDSKLAKL
ncbi:hypothetical protein HK096_000482 [Nowakowskiella sp. JEL0078]|nr:hypothetical protein HK096_000482 [Nowakowskiella sp. JEL0078]